MAKRLAFNREFTDSATKKPQPSSLKDFELDSIVSGRVLQYEKEEAYKLRNLQLVHKLELNIRLLRSNLKSEVLSEEDYLNNIKSKIQEYKELSSKVSKDLSDKLRKHIKIMQKELEDNDMEQDHSPPRQQPGNSNLAFAGPEYFRILELLSESKNALAYLINLGLRKNTQRLRKRIGQLQQALEETQAGKQSTPTLKELSPEDLTGVKETQRQQKLLELIEFCNTQIKEWRLACRSSDKESAQQYSQQIQEHTKRIQELEAATKNPWQIPPEIVAKSIKHKQPIVEESLRSDELQVKLEPLLVSRDYLILAKLEENSKLEFQLKETTTQTFQLESVESLALKNLVLEVIQKHKLRKNKTTETRNLALSGFSNKNQVQATFAFQKCKVKFKLQLTIRSALEVPQFTEVSEKVHFVEPLVHPFKSPLLTQNSEETLSLYIPGLTTQELRDPCHSDNLKSLSVLEQQERALTEMVQMVRAEDSSDQLLESSLESTKQLKHNALEKLEKNPSEYQKDLKNQIYHDIKLVKIFSKKEEVHKEETVRKRIATMQKELSMM